MAALTLAGVRIVEQGVIVKVGREKNDQEANGRAIGVFPGWRSVTCPVKALRAWLRFHGSREGPLFTRMDDKAPELAALSDRQHLRDRRIGDRPGRPRCVGIWSALAAGRHGDGRRDRRHSRHRAR